VFNQLVGAAGAYQMETYISQNGANLFVPTDQAFNRLKTYRNIDVTADRPMAEMVTCFATALFLTQLSTMYVICL